MSLPSFYISSYTTEQQEVVLDEDNSRHVIQVLRMNPGEFLQLTDGRGHVLEGEIVEAHKKRCRVAVRSVQTSPPPPTNVTIAISPVKNASRFEWFLEKATEIGVRTIIPVLCERTERQSIRTDRLRNILVSAMLQSQQTWLPILPNPMSFAQLVAQATRLAPVVDAGITGQAADASQEAADGIAGLRLIAHCLEAPRPTMSLAGLIREMAAPATGGIPAPGMRPVASPSGTDSDTLLLIGPEGDFSPKEVELALTAGYVPVSLGANRLRTETAGVVAAALLCIK